jgi:WD40 repeat protein
VERKWALCLSTMEKHISNVRSIAVSRDGAHIASGSLSGTLCLWDFETGTHLQCFPTPIEKIFSVAFSPSGARVASGSGDNIVRL